MKTQTEKQTLERLRNLRRLARKNCKKYQKNNEYWNTFSYGWDIGYKDGITQAIEILNNEIRKREI